jgi:hypothetical protein
MYAMYYASTLRCWQLVKILIRTNHPCLRVGCHTEAEYRTVANGVAEACWLRQLLLELHAPLSKSTLVYCDNVCVVYLSINLVHH